MRLNSLSNILIPAVLLSFLAACGGGGGGGGGGGAVTVSNALATGTFTKTTSAAIGSGDAVPFFNGSFGDQKAQTLYASTLVGGVGRITILRFKRAQTMAAPVTCPNTTVRLGHTSLAALTTTFATNVNQGKGSQLTVLSDATLIIPAGAENTFFDISLTTPFEYNGVDNLVVEVERTTTCSSGFGGGIRTVTLANVRARANATDTVAGTPQHDQATATVDGIQAIMQFVFAGGDNKLDFGGAITNTFSFNTLLPRVQTVYLASEIAGSGPITGVAFQANATTAAATYDYTLKLGHSTLAALTTTFDSNYSGSPTTVANAVTNFTIPAGIPAGEWIWVPIPDGVFTYNGTDNLIVDMTTNAASANTSMRSTFTTAGRRLFITPNNNVTGSADTVTHHIALRFNGGPVAVITDGLSTTSLPFSTGANANNGRLNLYRASELGSAGSISSVACRMQNATSTAASYATYQVIIGHSAVETLSATSASNFVSQNTAVDGTVSVPAGLVAGDWIEVPLTTPFAYDGKSNLAIWMGTTGASGAAATHTCRVSGPNVARYPEQMSFGAPGSATVTVQDFKFDMKLGILR